MTAAWAAPPAGYAGLRTCPGALRSYTTPGDVTRDTPQGCLQSTYENPRRITKPSMMALGDGLIQAPHIRQTVVGSRRDAGSGFDTLE